MTTACANQTTGLTNGREWQSGKLGTGSRVSSFLRAFPSPTDVPVLLLNQPIEIPEKQNLSQRDQSFAILAQEEELHFYVCKFTKAKLSGWSTFAGNDAQKLHLQTKVCFFHFKIVNSLLRGSRELN